MAIRKNTNPQPMEQREERPRFSWAIPSRDRGRQSQQMDLQPEMRDLLMRNGMQAHVVSNGSGYQLVVQGHDSPLLTYNITEKQMLALTDWGTNHANKLAYNTFTGIVGNDFYMPKNFVHAMPTVVWPWDCTVIVLVSASMDEWGASECHHPF